MDLAAELAELCGHQIGSAPFLESELGMGMNVPPPARQFGVHLCDTVENWHAGRSLVWGGVLGCEGGCARTARLCSVAARRPQARRLRSSSLCSRPTKSSAAARARGMRHRTTITTAA